MNSVQLSPLCLCFHLSSSKLLQRLATIHYCIEMDRAMEFYPSVGPFGGSYNRTDEKGTTPTKLVVCFSFH